MKVLVIIVTFNGMKWVERCLSSVQSSKVKADAFVVDNGSTDGTQEYIINHFPNTIFQQSEKNLGFGKANNIGLQYAIDNDYDYVYLLNQDAWIFPETIECLIRIMEANPDYGIISPFQMSADGYSIDSAFLSRMKSWDSYYSLVNDFYNGSVKEIYPVARVMAAHWFMTKKCIEIVGGFSPSFPHYGEDDNYSERVRYKGFKIGVVPKLKVVHDRQGRVLDKKKEMYQIYTAWLFMLSCPDSAFFMTLFRIFRGSLSSVKKFKSISPLAYFCKICANLNGIIKNKRNSMNTECAFLTQK